MGTGYAPNEDRRSRHIGSRQQVGSLLGMSTYDHTRQRVALVALLAIAAWLRLSGLDWDSGHHLHPDERFLTTVATDVRIPSGIRQYFDTARSPLNPANVGQKYFTYGTLPLFLVRAIA